MRLHPGGFDQKDLERADTDRRFHFSLFARRERKLRIQIAMQVSGASVAKMTGVVKVVRYLLRVAGLQE
jgi:hypothetical protein